MSHLHLPDGVLPVWLWGSGLALALLVLWRSTRGITPRQVAYQGALGGLMLAAMAIPLGALEYHLTLAGPLGVLLGSAGAFQVGFSVSAILAVMGHGGISTVGLNALITGAGAAGAALVYKPLGRRLRPEWAMAWSTAAGQALAGLLWLAIASLALESGSQPAATAGAAVAHTHTPLGRFALLAVPLWVLGVIAEAVVAWGIGRFLARVHPGLMPNGTAAAPVPGEAA